MFVAYRDKKFFILLTSLIFISCSKTSDHIDAHIGDYRGQGVEYSMYTPPDTVQLDVNVSAGDNSNELNMRIMGSPAVAKLIKDSFTLQSPTDLDFGGGNGIFAGDTMHISYSMQAGAGNYYLTLATLLRQ